MKSKSSVQRKQIENEVKEFFSNLFEKYPELGQITFHKVLAYSNKTKYFTIQRRHLSERKEYKIDMTIAPEHNIGEFSY